MSDDAVPLAKYTPGSNRFSYRYDQTSPSLYYVSLPPFGRPTYNFGSGTWGVVD